MCITGNHALREYFMTCENYTKSKLSGHKYGYVREFLRSFISAKLLTLHCTITELQQRQITHKFSKYL